MAEALGLDQEFDAQMDLRTLVEAERIKANKKRMEAVKTLVTQETKFLERLETSLLNNAVEVVPKVKTKVHGAD